ncbi:MAG: molybdopterin-guanine dinucleotide biosynthesis protein B [Pirellulales bacterium]|nr:molybdopterin-guanine dinucleotide biosynthesis protein B [Pirellulales bacterium]
MNRLHVIGRKNHGKTTLIVELIAELVRRGRVVGTIKHTHHRHELDVPGKDSHRHRIAGAAAVGVLSQGMSAIFLPADGRREGEDRYASFAPAFAGCDFVLVEGDSQTAAPKLEVWRADLGVEPLAATDDAVLAVATDDHPPCTAPVLRRSNLASIADWVLDVVG